MITFYRILKAGITSFRRNAWLSSATVLVLVMSLSVALSIVLLGVVVDGVVGELESKVDISVYFKPETSDEKIQEVRDTVEKFPEVLETRFTSRDQALELFRQRHGENDVIQAALSEIPENPLEASLAIQAADASAYEAIAGFLEGRFGELISKVNYRENSVIIERIFSATNAVRLAGIGLGAVLFFIAGLITFNTIRLAIFSSRDEIAVMRLVGGSNWFIRGPFVIEGIISGLIGAFVTFGLFWFLADAFQEPVARFVPSVDLLAYYRQNWASLFGLVAGMGVATSVVSSYIAIRRYLRV